MGKLTNKVAVITGASKGIGAAIARAFGAEGAAVVVNYATGREGADKVVKEIVSAGGRATAVGANVANADEVAVLFAQTKAIFGRVDVLVNNAGVYTFAPIEEFTVDMYRRLFDINVLGMLLCTKAAIPLFPTGGGAIVNVSSIASTLAPPATAVYSGTKGAVDSITKVLAKELGPRNIRVNAVNPGMVITDGAISAGIAGSDFEKDAVSGTPLGRVARPEDIALPAIFLASDDARHITGETIYISGGSGI